MVQQNIQNKTSALYGLLQQEKVAFKEIEDNCFDKAIGMRADSVNKE